MFVGGWALTQLWLFWVAPIIGAILGGIVYPIVVGKEVSPEPQVTGTRR